MHKHGGLLQGRAADARQRARAKRPQDCRDRYSPGTSRSSPPLFIVRHQMLVFPFMLFKQVWKYVFCKARVSADVHWHEAAAPLVQPPDASLGDNTGPAGGDQQDEATDGPGMGAERVSYINSLFLLRRINIQRLSNREPTVVRWFGVIRKWLLLRERDIQQKEAELCSLQSVDLLCSHFGPSKLQ